MALSSLTELDQFKAAPFPPGYPDTTRTFYSPVDQVHEALKALLTSANKSIVVAMYGYDDPELNSVLQSALNNENMYVQMSLDSTQAAGKAEHALLAPWLNHKIGNSIANTIPMTNSPMHTISTGPSSPTSAASNPSSSRSWLMAARSSMLSSWPLDSPLEIR